MKIKIINKNYLESKMARTTWSHFFAQPRKQQNQIVHSNATNIIRYREIH